MGAFSSSISFDPSKDIPSLAGKVILVTGGNSGLGEACVAAYALHKPAKIYLTARSSKRAAEAVSRITATLPDPSYASCIEVLDLDLASLSSVKAAGEKLLAATERLDIVQLNGGIGASPPGKSADGYEAHFGTNFLGHAALVQVLMPLFEKTAALPDVDDVRLVWITSIAHRIFSPAEGIAFAKLTTDFSREHGMAAYGNATLAKTLFAHQMSRRFGDAHIHSTSVHPGTVKTNIWNGEKSAGWLLQQVFKLVVFFTGVSSEEGAKTQLWASVSKDAKNGVYYEPVGKTSGAGKYAYDVEMGDKLWEWTAEQLKLHGFPGW